MSNHTTQSKAFVLDIYHPGKTDAGVPSYTDTVIITVESGDPGAEPGEFAEAMQSYLKEWFEGARVSIAAKPPVDEPQIVDEQALSSFAIALREKLAQARAKGRSGWQDPAWSNQEITKELLRHVEKDDPLDVAIYAMFLHQRGKSCKVHQSFG